MLTLLETCQFTCDKSFVAEKRWREGLGRKRGRLLRTKGKPGGLGLRNGVHSFDRITISPILSEQSRENIKNINLPIHKWGERSMVVTLSNENWIILGGKKKAKPPLNYPGSGQNEEVAKAPSNLGRAH